MANVQVYYRDNYITSDGLSSVYVYVRIKERRISFKTGVKVAKNHWDNVKFKVKPSHPNYSDYNLIISSVVSRVNDILIRYRLQGKELTIELLKSEYDTPSYYVDFYEWVDKIIKERKPDIAHGTYKQHVTAINKLKDFKKRLYFSEITSDFIDSYRRYLKKTLKNHPNTIHGNLKNLKVYLNIAKKKGIIKASPFDDYKLKQMKTERAFLDEQELKDMFELYKSNELSYNKQNTLRAFLFSCFTGLRLSDVKAFTKENIVKDTIILKMQKTKNINASVVIIPVSPPTRQLISDCDNKKQFGTLFETPTDPKMNLHLKIFATMLEIPKTISFHSGRHTFATVFLKRTKNLAALQKLLGHSNIRETMIYAHVLTEELESEMKCFNDF